HRVAQAPRPYAAVFADGCRTNAPQGIPALDRTAGHQGKAACRCGTGLWKINRSKRNMLISQVKTIGILGAGRVGTAIARRALAAGYAVRMATSKAPEEIALVLEIMVPGAQADTAENVIAAADIVVLALPLSRYRSLVPEQLTGKIVIDAMNYWAPTDGTIAEFEG